jgi:hypothetical protein
METAPTSVHQEIYRVGFGMESVFTYTLIVTLLGIGTVIERAPGLSAEECIGRAAAVDPGQANARCELVQQPDAPPMPVPMRRLRHAAWAQAGLTSIRSPRRR